MGAADAMTHDLPKSGYVDFPGDAAQSGKLARKRAEVAAGSRVR